MLTRVSGIRSHTGPTGVRMNMTPVLEQVVTELKDASGDRAVVHVEDHLEQDLMLAMDPEAFGLALRTLLGKAVQLSAGPPPVRLVINADWTIRVVGRGRAASAASGDTGTRFVRVETAAEGSSLGLGIVGGIMADCGGALLVRDAPLERDAGFEAVLHLP